MNLKLECFEFIGRNDSWQFAVAKAGDRWLGVALEGQATRAARAAFASEGLPHTQGYMHVFAEVSQGYGLGMTDKCQAMLLVGALAQDPEQSFGGIDEWLVPEDMRGRPEMFVCERCGAVLCLGRECEDEDGADNYQNDEGDE